MSVALDVGGIVYKTSQTTLTSFPDSFFSRLFDGNWKEQEDRNGRIFIDRDGHTFRYVLEFLRNRDKTILPNDKLLLEQIKLEAEFFSLPQLTKMIDYHLNLNLKEVEIVFHEENHAGTAHSKRRDTLHLWDSVVLSLAQMLSVPDSFFWHLANNIINRMPQKLDLPVSMLAAGVYYVQVGAPGVVRKHRAKYARQVAEMLKLGKLNFDVYTAFESSHSYSSRMLPDFIETAKLLGVPYAIEHGLQLLEKIQKPK